MGTALRLRVEGLRDLQRKLRNDGQDLTAAPYRDALTASAQAVARAARSAAPVDSGRLKDRITHRVQAAPIPRYAVVKTGATRSSKAYRRYSYPRRLEFDPRSRHRDWLLKALLGQTGTVRQLLNRAARQIERRWAR